MQITFDEKKKLDTNPIFGLFVQGENRAESIQIKGPKVLGALDLSQLRMAVRVTSPQYKTTVEKTLEQTADEDTITLTWNVDKQFTGSPGPVQVMLIGYGGNNEVIKITSSGITVKEDQTFGDAPPESTWEQILQQMQAFAAQAYESKTAAKISETNAKASETAAKTSETNAKASETAAASSAAAAKTSETNAAGSVSTASAKAEDAGESASAAAASAAAAKTSEINAKASETAAKTSETNAASSETNAAGSASTASAKADDAGESASAAAASAVAAKTSETNAKASETAAKTSETNAKASETAAASSASAAKTSASAAASSETNAANSKTAAADSASAAAGSASAAENSASAAAVSASAAENSASAAAGSQKAAEEKAAQATNAAGTAVAAAGTAAADAAAQAAAKTEQQIRRYADDRYARPLVTKTGPAASLEVYPDEQSNLKVYANGFTRQAGSGDPSPTNVRAITNGGIVLHKTVFNGSENWQPAGGGIGETRYFLLNGAYSGDLVSSALYSERYPGVPITTTNSVQGISGYKTTCYIRDSKYDTVDDFKAALQANPLLVWYATTDGTGTLYAPIVLEGGEYRATCLPLTAPLCEGDSVVSWARSGCDKVLVLDGQNNGLSVQSINSLDIVNFSLFRPEVLNIINRIGYSEYLPNMGSTTIANATSPGFIISGNTIYTRLAGADLVSYGYAEKGNTAQALTAGKAYFAAHPLTVWYRSTNYTPAADIPVSLETHQQAVLVLYGTEKSHTYADLLYLDEVSTPFAKDRYSGICSHYQYTLYAIGKISVDDGSAGASSVSVIYNPGGAYTVDEEGLTKWKADLAAQYAAGTPVTIVYQIATPITYAHPAVVLPALPDDTGKVTITGQRDGTVTAVFNKSIIKEIAEIKAAMLAMGANLSM